MDSEVVKNPGATIVPNGSGDKAADSPTDLPSLKEFASARVNLQALVNDWEQTREKAKENRKTRDIQVSIETLRRDGTLDEDETLIPVRTIDTNIARELPPFVNYIKNSRRVCIFTCLSNPACPTDKIELEFTRGMTYPKWENDHFKTLDGAATHGWDACEVVFDPSKPLNVGVEHIGNDRLFWPRTCIDIQQAPRIIREYDYSLLELKKFVDKYEWDSDQVSKIIQSHKDSKRDGDTNKIYKVMFKEEGIVWSGWFALTDGVSDWLRAPEPHYIGIDKQDVTGQWVPDTLTEYPVFILPYRESEKPKLVERHGRVFLDGPKQEAQTAVLSGYVNGLTRATRILGSPKQDDGTGNSVKELENTTLAGGAILNKPIDFYSPPYPDPQILRALSYMDTANSQETSQVNFAVMNREDSRKTAKEISLAEQQASLLNSVQLTLFSTHIRTIYSLCWKVVQSQALQNNVKFLLINQPQPQINPATQQPITDPQTGQPLMQDNWVNDTKTIAEEYELRAAGDVDVIQKNERVQQMKQDWQVIQNTPLSLRFLCDLIRLSYPDKGDDYAKVLEQGQANEVKTLGGLVAGFTEVVSSLVKNHPELIKSLDPVNQQKLGQMIQAGQQVQQQVTGQQQKGGAGQ